MMKLVLLGPPGAGKGTLANLLKNDLKIEHISTGDILREEMKNGTSLGRQVKSYIEKGDLVPDEVVTKIIEQKLTGSSLRSKGFMLDGFPRTTTQAEDLDKILNLSHNPITYALYLEVSLPVVIQRLTGRRVCRKCGAVFHETNRPPKAKGICDICGGELYQRADDKEETIRARLDVYNKSTAPIIDYYEKQSKLLRADSNKDSEEVHFEVINIFRKDGTINSDQVQRRT